jgi:hypothetical protein
MRELILELRSGVPCQAYTWVEAGWGGGGSAGGEVGAARVCHFAGKRDAIIAGEEGFGADSAEVGYPVTQKRRSPMCDTCRNRSGSGESGSG